MTFSAVFNINRCRLLCCCVSKNTQTANAFENVAYLISDYFQVCFISLLSLLHTVWLWKATAVPTVLHCVSIILITRVLA